MLSLGHVDGSLAVRKLERSLVRYILPFRCFTIIGFRLLEQRLVPAFDRKTRLPAKVAGIDQRPETVTHNVESPVATRSSSHDWSVLA